MASSSVPAEPEAQHRPGSSRYPTFTRPVPYPAELLPVRQSVQVRLNLEHHRRGVQAGTSRRGMFGRLGWASASPQLLHPFQTSDPPPHHLPVLDCCFAGQWAA
eukprot:1158606-Pelagomonas_calceolata.AAC.3